MNVGCQLPKAEFSLFEKAGQARQRLVRGSGRTHDRSRGQKRSVPKQPDMACGTQIGSNPCLVVNRGHGFMPNLESDVVGQVERLPLKPSEANALLPLYEAVSNSLHAIQDRFGDKRIASDGRVDIRLTREEVDAGLGPVCGFEIADNGVGLNDDNYRSFLTPFSVLKMKRGGKGVGRLGWLKVFDDIRVHSAYHTAEGIASRDFNFILRKTNQIAVRTEGLNGHTDVGTTVTLKSWLGAFGPKCPMKTVTIAQRIIGHFLPIFAGDKAPAIYLHDEEDGVIDLKAEFAGKVKRTVEDLIDIEIDGDMQPFIIRHMQCDKSIRPRGGQNHWLCFCADDRGVKEYAIDEQIGLALLDGEDIYVGTVTSDFLDKHVNPQRTDFTFEAEDGRSIRRRLATSVRDFLGEYLESAMAQKKFVVNSIIMKNPQYLYLQGEIDTFVRSLKPNSIGEEDIYQEMSLHRLRRQRHFNGMKQDINSAKQYTSAIAEKVEEYKAFIVDDQKGALAEYVARRKSVLDLFNKMLGFEGPEDTRHHLEEAVHSLICPMRVDSHQLEIEDHNLWILDDRLAFFSFFASDRPLSQISGSASGREPDMAVFYDSCIAWRESDRVCDTVILVEFKRPGLPDYTDKNDPYMQLMDYVTLFKAGKTVKDRKGRVINGIGNNTAFHCYIVADLTEGLQKRLRGRFQPTPDGRGLFGYTTNPDAYVEVIPYAKLLLDAQARNAIFFEKLGLNN